MAVYVPNPDFEREFNAEDDGYLEGPAKAVAAEANRIAPRIMPRDGGPAVDVQTSYGDTYVVNRDHGGHLAEWGSKNNPPYSPLRRAVRALGLKFSAE